MRGCSFLKMLLLLPIFSTFVILGWMSQPLVLLRFHQCLSLSLHSLQDSRIDSESDLFLHGPPEASSCAAYCTSTCYLRLRLMTRNKEKCKNRVSYVFQNKSPKFFNYKRHFLIEGLNHHCEFI